MPTWGLGSQMRNSGSAEWLCQLQDPGHTLAELLADIETDPDDLTRLRLIGALREVLA